MSQSLQMSSQSKTLEIRKNESLKNHCTLKIGGSALFFAFPKTLEELRSAVLWAAQEKLKVETVGAGSNILFSDAGFSGLLIGMKKFEPHHVVFGENEIEVSAGISNYQLILAVQKKNIGGFEFLAHIPGTIGGACKMNAGFSHIKGVRREISSILKSVTIMNDKGELKTLTHDQIEFSYRKTNLPKGVIVYAVIRTQVKSSEEIENELREIELYRRSVQDVRYPSAGSMFKNPEGQYSSGQLIDMAGLKGKAIGGAQISEKHGNFFINRGQATSKEMMELIQLAKRTVKERFGVDLEMEVRYFES